jgi:hypothetical protein
MFKIKNPHILKCCMYTKDIHVLNKIETIAYGDCKDTNHNDPYELYLTILKDCEDCDLNKGIDNTLDNYVIKTYDNLSTMDLMNMLKKINLKILLKQSMLKDFKV